MSGRPSDLQAVIAEMRALTGYDVARMDTVLKWADRLAALGASPAVDGLTFTHATIDKLQAVMAVHGFVVPVRVISDAFRTTGYAQKMDAQGGKS